MDKKYILSQLVFATRGLSNAKEVLDQIDIDDDDIDLELSNLLHIHYQSLIEIVGDFQNLISILRKEDNA
jgi:hypothetical protein